MIGWFIIMQDQKAGKFLCGTVKVQVSDEVIPTLGTFKGLFESGHVAPMAFGSTGRIS